jgi:hypothetical protein
MTETRYYSADTAGKGILTVIIYESESATYTAEYFGADALRKRHKLTTARNFNDAVRLIRNHLESKYGTIKDWQPQ